MGNLITKISMFKKNMQSNFLKNCSVPNSGPKVLQKSPDVFVKAKEQLFRETNSADEISEFCKLFIQAQFQQDVHKSKLSKLRFLQNVKNNILGRCMRINSWGLEKYLHSRARVFVLKNNDGKIKGGIALAPFGQDLEITALYLDKTVKSRRVFSELIKQIKEIARESGCNSLICNTGKVKLLKRLGFIEEQKTYVGTSMRCDIENFAKDISF